MYFIKACQNDLNDKCTSTVLTVRILGNDYQPDFSKSIYHAEKLLLTVGTYDYFSHELCLKIC